MKTLALAVVLAAFAAGFAAAEQSEILAPLNDAVNAVLAASGAPNREAARVVPLLGQGGVQSGYAQIVGPQARVAATRAVITLTTAAPNGSIQTFIPVTTVSRGTGTLHREYGVSVDALVRGGP